ncbi:MAG: NAD(P)H-dependent oxidoreductase subunit E [Gammaproteobacteria bacterium]|nr:NAD(P)H-dependent oxidoreductase subunit E [Gammaproteobacteria bacterium]
MVLTTKKPAPPSDDRRWKIVDATMRRHGYSSEAVIETLHTIQESFGNVDEAALAYVSSSLNVPPSKVFGVATFYSHFNMIPLGEHVISVCTGTACYVKGSGEVVEWIKQEYGLEPGQTTPDNKLTFMVARCVGACGLAPVLILDGEVVGKLSVDDMKKRIKEWMSHDK